MDLYEQRIESAILDTQGAKEKVMKDIKVRQGEAKATLATLKTAIPIKKTLRRVEKSIFKKAEFKKVLKKSPRATVVVNQPVYTEDKSRFFKDEWDEEKRSLFFK